ncbi:MAG: protein kinase [Pseudomonadota bacterium]
MAAGITYYRGNEIANKAVVSALENIRSVQESVEAQRFQQLALISEIFASDPYFSSYVAEATGDDLGLGGDVDSGSIVDLLIEREQELGFDFAMVLDPEGEVIANTSEEDFNEINLSTEEIVSAVIESLESSAGYWFREDDVYQIAVVPLADQQDLVGFLLTALMVDDDVVEGIKKISGSELVFLKSKKDELIPMASTLDSNDISSLLNYKSQLLNALGKEPVELRLNGDVWLASVANADKNHAKGMTVALTSLAEATADFRAIENVLLIVTVVSILLALPISLMITKGITSPIKRLATAAHAAARGDYKQRFETKGKDELAKLTTSFDTLLSDLREKNDMEGYMSELAKHLPESIENRGVGAASKTIMDLQSSGEGIYSLLGIDLRRYAKQADNMMADEVYSILNASLNNLDSLATAFAGNMLGISGHRILIVFSGADSHKRALALAGNALTSLMSQGEGIAAAIVKDKAVLGLAAFGDKNLTNCLGTGVYKLDRLLQEAAAGTVFIGPNIHDEIKQELPNFKPLIVEGAVSKKKYYALKASDGNIFNVQAEGDGIEDAEATEVGGNIPKTLHVMPGMSLGGRYEIISELGAGGMGIVYKAHDHDLDDLVALKMLRVTGTDGSQQLLDAMKSEIRLARKITHPAVLRTYDYGELEGFPYISMEYVRGLTLKYLINQSEGIPYSAGLRIAKQLAAGLNAAHAEGILHRDIKPENIILEQNGNAKLMDFGIARHVSGSGLGELEGSVMGTPRYAAPEQLCGEAVDERADIYSSGILMYQMYTRNFPHTGKNLEELIQNKLTKEPVLPSKYWQSIPSELEELIMNCIEIDPKNRLKNAEIFIERLEVLRA